MIKTESFNLIEVARKSADEIFDDFETRADGLSEDVATKRQAVFGFNEFRTSDKKGLVIEFLSKFANPLVILLIVIATFSAFFGQKTSALIIIGMAVMSVVLSFVQERHASRNAEKLRAMVKVTALVIRGGKKLTIPLREIVPGDIVELAAGKMVPADVRIISSNNLFVSQSALNGESFPAKKTEIPASGETDNIFGLDQIAFMGSNAVSGYGQGVVLRTGTNTEFGKLSREITKVTVENGFDRGIKSFTWLMIRLIFVLTILIFFINAVFKGNMIEALLFALAVAVGLAPEMLPMIVTVNLSKGAIDISKKKVIIKELDAIQNFGAMDTLCTDKTGTLTLDEIVLVKHSDASGNENDEVLRYAYLNSFFQKGLDNLMDKAVLERKKFDTGGISKIDEIPFDFERKVVSIIVSENKKYELVTKGAPEKIFKLCKEYLVDGKIKPLGKEIRGKLSEQYDEYSKDGFRVLAVAYKNIEQKRNFSLDDENDLIFAGFVAFLDPPKPTAEKAIRELERLGISLKVLSGDNELVTRKICNEVNIGISRVLSGAALERLDDHELDQIIEKTNIFTRLTPLQKERIIKSLQRNGKVVGFLGDGINDAPALKAADVGISVDNATDIAKETAEIILLEKNLNVLSDCVIEGRKVFANVTKYIKMGASSNFGNMLSMTGASIFLPFLPMLPVQVLLNNFLYDVSQTAIPTDNVDEHYLLQPRPWNVKFIKEFILYIGPISSIYDFLTFGIMRYVFHADQSLFHTGWFIESLFTQILVVHIIRTNKIPFLESKPSKILLLSTIGVILLSVLIPYSALAKPLGFVPLPALFFIILIMIALTYLFLVQIAKKWFIRKFGYE